MTSTSKRLFLQAANGHQTTRPPIWLMRQAGRCDPAYRKFRAERDVPLENLFRDPEAAAYISLLPARWGVDAIIIFQDILTPLSGMGAPFVFRPGPQPEQPLTSPADFMGLHQFDMAEELPFLVSLYDTLRDALKSSELPIIGFAGAPFTLLAFLAENGSPPADLPNTRALLQEHPATMRRFLDTLAAMTTDYLLFQISLGAETVQLFESTAHCLHPEEYATWALPYQQQVFDGIRHTGAPSIFFARRNDAHISPATLQQAGASVLSLSSAYSLAATRATLGVETPLQGNLDNQLLANGPVDAILRAAQRCIEEGECRGHIFNLGHGVLPHTPFEHVKQLVAHVRAYEKPGVSPG